MLVARSVKKERFVSPPVVKEKVVRERDAALAKLAAIDGLDGRAIL
jgi:hypothetical protein